jgi:alkanesulfonate monooxygenase SsuD/methylene tetrahydromethanopterin reductase-like flavin-dependent oxidoreductase (luciferase family)
MVAGADGSIQADFPVGIDLRPIGKDFAWWCAQAKRLDAAGYAGIWHLDYLMSARPRTQAIPESFTTLAFTAAVTSRLMLGTYVANVMNRHPAVLAKAAATFQEASGGRLILGIGIGGTGPDNEAYGIPFPPVPERVERLVEAVAVLRALWTGGPVTLEGRYYPLRDAVSYPIPEPPPPIIIGGETRAGARLAGRIGDGWTTMSLQFERDLPAYLESLSASGRERRGQRVLVAFDLPDGERLEDSLWTKAPEAEAERWRAAGADGAIVAAKTTADVDALVHAAERR